jgi:gliding motility-associated protein GldE
VSGSEVALFSIDYPKRIEFKTSSDLREKKIAEILEKPQKLLATILILNNLCNITFVTMATYWSFSLFKVVESEKFYVLLVTIAITLCVVFLGEIVPKVYAKQKSVEVAKLAIYPIYTMMIALAPLSYFLISLGNIAERILGKEKYKLSISDLSDAIDLHYEKDISEEHKGILKGVINFGTITTKQVMKSRIEIAAAEYSWSLDKVVEFIKQMGYSRIPVYKNSIDYIVGILYAKDLIIHYDKTNDLNWHSYIRPAYFVPENKKIDSLLREFQKRRVHIAIVVDEYGGTSGLVTMEDIIEEVVGEINDEYDEIEKIIEKISDNEFLVDTKITINDFLKKVELPLDFFEDIREDCETIAGLLLNINKNMPNVGDVIKYKEVEFEVISIEKKRIGKAKAKVLRI